MKKIIITIILAALFYSQNYAILPDGRRAVWQWFGASLGLITENECIWNEGEPRPCTLTELSIMFYYY